MPKCSAARQAINNYRLTLKLICDEIQVMPPDALSPRHELGAALVMGGDDVMRELFIYRRMTR